MDVKQETLETYNLAAESYFKRTSDHFYNDEFDYFNKNISGKKIIDLGCGTGRDASIFIKAGFDYSGIDISQGMIDVAIKHTEGGQFYQSDFSKIDFPDNSFDGFWAAASFLHIPKNEVDKVLWEAKRITKNNGLGFISLKEGDSKNDGMIIDERHAGRRRYFSYYTQDEFSQILQIAGYEIIKVDIHPYKATNTNWLCLFVRVKK